MNLRTLLLFCFCFLASIVSAQEYAIDRKATIISGTLSYLNQSGNLFTDSDGNNTVTFTFSPSINHFISKNVFLGGGVEFTSVRQGDFENSAFGIGPQIGYAFGNPESGAFPYFDLGVRYYSVQGDSGFRDYTLFGSDIAFGFGIIVPVRKHIGLIFEGGYHMLKLKETGDSEKGKIFTFGIGLAGLIYNAE